MSTKEVYLDGSPPWGFRMNGGADAGHPLRISRVNPGSKAEGKGVREGDLITSINGQSTKCLTNSESHALLRTVKENLLLGLNEDKNASPRRRSREIKSASIVSEDKEEYENPANSQPTGGQSQKLSSNQKRQQRRSRLKGRIKEFLGLSPKKEDRKGKKSESGEVWVIVDSGLTAGQETRSVSELDTEDECNNSSPSSLRLVKRDDPEKVFDSIDFKKCRVPPPVNFSEQTFVKSETENINNSVNNSLKNSSRESKVKKTIHFESVEKKSLESDDDLWLKRNKLAELKPNEAIVCEDVDFSESLELTEPCVEMIEVCNATIRVENENLTSQKINIPLVVTDEDSSKPRKDSNPDYEPIEVVILPPYQTANGHFYPSRRFLEVISEEASDLSESNDEKQAKPWENSDLIRRANDIESIPKDWYGSDEGIDTSWRDGRSIEEVSDVAVVSDSFSDSDLISEELKINRGLSEDTKHKYNVSKSSPLEPPIAKTNSLFGKPPRQSLQKVIPKPGHNSHLSSKPNCPKKLECNPPKMEIVKQVFVPEKIYPEVENVGSKVTCKMMKQGEVLFSPASNKAHLTQNSAPVTDKSVSLKSANSSKNIASPETSKKSVDALVKEKGQQHHENLVNPPLKLDSQKCMRTSSSDRTERNVIITYCPEPKKSAMPLKEHKFACSKVELNAAIVKAGSDVDVELVYIDSSDSDAISSNLSPSNRTSLATEKDEMSVLAGNDATFSTPAESCNLITEDISTITTSAKEISGLSTSENNPSKFHEDVRNNLPNLLSPVLNKKTLLPTKASTLKRRNSYPMCENEFLAKFSEKTCHNCSATLSPNLDEPTKNIVRSKGALTPVILSRESKAKDSPAGFRKLSLRSLTPSPNVFKFPPSSIYGNPSVESVLLEYSDGSLSSESYTLPDIAPDHDFPDVSHGTVKHFHIPFSRSSPKVKPASPAVTPEIVDLHKKFVERRGYHEASPILLKKLSQSTEKTPEPDLIALSKCQNHGEQAYTPELLAEAANLLALHKYHESRQKKMKSQQKENSVPKVIDSKPNLGVHIKEISISTKSQPEIDVNERLTECKEEPHYKSVCPENETVGKSRLLELFQKLEEKSSTTECSTGPDTSTSSSNNIDKSLQSTTHTSSSETSAANILPVSISDESVSDHEDILCSRKSLNKILTPRDSTHELISLPPGEITNKKMYEEYLGKMAELAERRSAKIIRISNLPCLASPPNCEGQDLEKEFMNKLKERNEKLGIAVEESPSELEDPAASRTDGVSLPKHLKELMDITQECGDIVGKDGLLVEIDEALSPERKGFLTAKGVWSPAQTPEAERKKFAFPPAAGGEEEEQSGGRRRRTHQEGGEARKSCPPSGEETAPPSPPVWTPRSATSSPVPERKFRSVNFQASPPPQRKQIRTITNETPELPKELPIDTEKDLKSRLTSSSSDNSHLSSSLKLPPAQNPTITLLQKAREGQIPRGAQYLEEQPKVGPDEIIYSVKGEHVSEDQSKKIVELGPRKIEGIGPTTKEGIPIVLRSEVKEDNQQRWYKRMYDSLHKTELDKDFVTVKYKTRKGHYPYSSYSGGYSSEPERHGYDSDASVSKYATLDRRKIKNKENDFTTSTMPRNRYASPGVKYAVDVYKNQPGRIEDYEPGHSSIAEKEKKQWWDEVMDIFDGELNESKGNNLSSKSTEKPYTYSLKEGGYESDSTLVFKRRENNMSSGGGQQALSPTDQKMAYKVIQRGGEVPFQGLRKAAPQRPKEDSEIEYFPLSPTLTRIRVHKKVVPQETVFQPMSREGGGYLQPVKRPRALVPSPPRRESSRYNSTLKMFAHILPSSSNKKEELPTRSNRSNSVDITIEKSPGKIKSTLVKYESPKSQYGINRQKKEPLRKSPDLKSPTEVKKALREPRTLSGTTVKSSTTLYSTSRTKKPKEDKALKVTVAISTKGNKEILSPSSTSSKSDYRKSPLPVKLVSKPKPESPASSRFSRPPSRLSVASNTLSEQPKKIKKEIIDSKKKKDKKTESISKVIDKNNKEDDKKKIKKKPDNGKKKNGNKKKDKENIPQETPTINEIIPLPEPPKKQDFFQKLLLRESNSPSPSINPITVSRTPSVLERAKKFTEHQKACFKSEPSLRNLNVYLSQKKPVSESRFRSLERDPREGRRALSPFFGTFEFFDRLDKFDRQNNVWDCSLSYGQDSVKSRSSSEPPHTSPPFSPAEVSESLSPSTSRSPSCRRIRRPTSRAIETISGVKRKFRSKSLNEADRQSHLGGSTSSLSLSQFTDHEDYKSYVLELVHKNKKSEKFKELHKFYSSLERMAQLEKTTSNTDLRPRMKGEEVIDFDRWKLLRNKEKAEKELSSLYEKLKDDQKEKGFLFQPKEPVRWSGDLGLRHKEKSVEDLRAQYQQLVEKSLADKKQDVISKDFYKPLWRGNSVANLAYSLTSVTGSKRGRPIKEDCQSLVVKPPIKKDKEIGSRLWSSLSMEQVNALKNQLSEIYSTVSNLKNERIQKLRQNIEDYEVNISDLREGSPLHVRSNSLVATNQLYSPAMKKKVARRQECMKADSISTLPSWKPSTLSENDKKKLSMSLSAEVKERIKRKKHGSLVIPRETLGAVAAVKGCKKYKSPGTSEASPRTCYSLLSDDSIDRGDDKNKDFLLVLTPNKEKAGDFQKMVDDWGGSKEHARLVQTTSSSSSSASTVIHLGYKEDAKASNSRLGEHSQSQTDLRRGFDSDRAERKTLYSSQSFSNLKDLFGEKNATPYATLPLRNIKKPCYSSNDSLYKSISPDPMKYYRAYLNVVKAGDVRKLREKFESYDDIYNLRKEQSPVRKMFQSDPDLTRDFLARKGGEYKRVVVKGQEVGDVQHLRRKYEPRKVSPVPFRVEDRYMPRINVISKTASLQRRSASPHWRGELSQRTGMVGRLKERFEKGRGLSLLGQMYTSTPEMQELRDIAPYLECDWVAHQNPRRSPTRLRRQRPASSSPAAVRHSILKSTDIFADQEFNPEIHRPAYRYQPEPWPHPKHWPRPTVTFKVTSRNDIDSELSVRGVAVGSSFSHLTNRGEPERGRVAPPPLRDLSSGTRRSQESPHRYVEGEVNIHYRSPVRREAKVAWPEDELAQRQAEVMRRIYQEQKRTKYLNELHDMYSRRHADNLLPSQKSPIPLNRYDDFPVETGPPRPRDRTPEPKLVARALYNFVGQSSRELSFRRGDIIYVRRQIDKNWYEGEHNAMIGLFPFNYVEIIPYDGIRTLPKKASEGQARARFNFQAQTHLELSLVKGELVLLTRRVDENWFEGRIGNRKGIFPVSYVEVLVEPGERPETPGGDRVSKPVVAPASHSILLNGAKDLGQQSAQPPRPALYSVSALPPSSKMSDISMVNQALHIETQSDPVPYRVLYHYRPQNEDELELKEGDIVYVMEKCDDGWYVGSLHGSGQFGTFPGNYVERIH